MAKATMRSREQTASVSFACDICGGQIGEGDKYLRTADVIFDKDEGGSPFPHLRRGHRTHVLKTHLRGECRV